LPVSRRRVETPGRRSFPPMERISVSADRPTEGTSADSTRSGADITEAIEVAEQGSSVQDVHGDPEHSKSGNAPVEKSAGDPEMTEGQVVLGEGDGGEA